MKNPGLRQVLLFGIYVLLCVVGSGCGNQNSKPEDRTKKPEQFEPTPPGSLEIQPGVALLESGGTKSMRARIWDSAGGSSKVDDELSWTSRSPDVAAVSSSGTVTGKSRGRAEIVVTTGSGREARATIYVGTSSSDQPVAVRFSKPLVHLEAGNSADLTPTVLRANGTENEKFEHVEFRTANPDVVEISGTTVRTTGEGAAQIVPFSTDLQQRGSPTDMQETSQEPKSRRLGGDLVVVVGGNTAAAARGSSSGSGGDDANCSEDYSEWELSYCYLSKFPRYLSKPGLSGELRAKVVRSCGGKRLIRTEPPSDVRYGGADLYEPSKGETSKSSAIVAVDGSGQLRSQHAGATTVLPVVDGKLCDEMGRAVRVGVDLGGNWHGECSNGDKAELSLKSPEDLVEYNTRDWAFATVNHKGTFASGTGTFCNESADFQCKGKAKYSVEVRPTGGAVPGIDRKCTGETPCRVGTIADYSSCAWDRHNTEDTFGRFVLASDSRIEAGSPSNCNFERGPKDVCDEISSSGGLCDCRSSEETVYLCKKDGFVQQCGCGEDMTCSRESSYTQSFHYSREKFTLSGAKSYCENLELGGSSSWRLFAANVADWAVGGDNGCAAVEARGCHWTLDHSNPVLVKRNGERKECSGGSMTEVCDSTRDCPAECATDDYDSCDGCAEEKYRVGCATRDPTQ